MVPDTAPDAEPQADDDETARGNDGDDLGLVADGAGVVLKATQPSGRIRTPSTTPSRR